MIRIEKNVLYSREDLRQMLRAAGEDPEPFLERLAQGNIFDHLWSGVEVLAFIRAALGEVPIDPQSLYSRKALAIILSPFGLDVDHFTRRIGARKAFKMAWLGRDILEALAECPALRRRNDGSAVMPAAARRRRRKAVENDRAGSIIPITDEEIGIEAEASGKD